MKPHMKVIHIHARSKKPIELSDEVLKLPKPIGLVTTIQHLEQVKGIKKKGFVFGGQVLGCNTAAAERIADKVKSYLFIGGGRFHPLAVAFKTGKTVYCYDPADMKLGKIDAEDIEALAKRRKAGIMNYLHGRKVGILVSVKSGQEQMKRAIEFKKRMEKAQIEKKKFGNDNEIEPKEYFIFAFETLDVAWLEHFPFVDVWVNTACPRITEDTSKMANIMDIEAFLKDRRY